MCEVGMRVHVARGVDEVGTPVEANTTGIVIGHLGSKWAIVSLDNKDGTGAGRTMLVPDGSARPVNRQQRARSVVVHPSGAATPLSRKDSARVHVRTPK